MSIIIKNIKQLVQVRTQLTKPLIGKELKELPCIKHAFLLIEDGKIKDFGKMQNCPNTDATIIDATGKLVFPTFCDSHSHIVYAGTRENEYVMRIKGMTYEEIAANGGGIINSAKKLAKESEEELFQQSSQRVKEIIQTGTGAIEIKSGYGLSVDAEIKMLRVIKRLKAHFDIAIKATFLGAHAIPSEYKENRNAYIDLIINEMLPIIQHENLADFIDVFCETGYYTPEETNRILKAGMAIGLKPKVHVNQFTSIGGIQTCIENNAISVDHLEVVKGNDINDLKESQTIATLLPSCSFFLNIPYAPAKQLIESNIPIALASDYNPGSTPSGNIPFVLSLACIHMKLLPEEAINAATINGSFAMQTQNHLGAICKGYDANVFITKAIPSYNFIPYSFGANHIETTILKGNII